VIPVTSIRTLAEWLLILVPLSLIVFLGFHFIPFSGMPAADPSGLSDNGGFFQTPLPVQEQYTTSAGSWQYTFTSRYAYTLAGKVVGRHDYPADLPEGVIPLDLAVANGDLLKPGILPDFEFTMGDHTLEFSYMVPESTGLTDEYIQEHVSNNHLVFLNSTLENEVKGTQVGDCMVIRGKLVDIRGTSRSTLFQMDTSTVRNDTYPAGCEIVLVESWQPVSC